MKPKFSATTVGPLIKLMMSGAHTPKQLAEKSGYGIETIHLICKSMHEHKVIHIVEWVFEVNRYYPAYLFGEGEDVKERWTTIKKQIFNIFKNDQIGRTAQQIAELIGANPSTITKDLNDLQRDGYLWKSRPVRSNEPTVWVRNVEMAFPVFGDDIKYVPRKPAPKRAPPPKQDWFSPIVR